MATNYSVGAKALTSAEVHQGRFVTIVASKPYRAEDGLECVHNAVASSEPYVFMTMLQQ